MKLKESRVMLLVFIIEKFGGGGEEGGFVSFRYN